MAYHWCGSANRRLGSYTHCRVGVAH
jgi:hypothetical protein